MKVLDVTQGSDEWHALRDQHPSASEASIIFGANPNVSRLDLMDYQARGEKPQHSRYVEDVIFASGHEIEAQARPIIEHWLGEDLYPITATDDDGWLLASFDGVTFDNRVNWECKQWNKDKAEKVKANTVPATDYWQLVHQFAVNPEAERILYTVTDGTEANTLTVEIRPHEGEFADQVLELKRHWALFERDRASYVPPERDEGHGLGGALESFERLFPARGDGLPDLPDDMDDFVLRVNSVLDTIPLQPQSGDKPLADADSGAKWCASLENRIDAVRDELIRTHPELAETLDKLDEARDAARDVRLKAEKVVKKGKDERKKAEEDRARERFIAYVTEQADEYAQPALECIGDVIDASPMKGKKTLKGCRDAMEQRLAEARIEADSVIEAISQNIEHIQYQGLDYLDLSDWRKLLRLDPRTFAERIEQRIANQDPELMPHSAVRLVADTLASDPEIDLQAANRAAQMLANDQIPGVVLYSQTPQQKTA